MYLLVTRCKAINLLFNLSIECGGLGVKRDTPSNVLPINPHIMNYTVIYIKGKLAHNLNDNTFI